MNSLHTLPFPGTGGDMSRHEPTAPHGIETPGRSTDRAAGTPEDPEDDLRPARGIGAAVAIGAALWVLLIAVGWVIFR
jgi:hypothetical protein